MPEKTRPAAPASDTRRAIRLIGAFLAVRTIAAWFFPATIDEAVGIVVSRAWSLSYFEHPPACFTLARLVAWLTGSEDIFGVRIPFLLAGAASSWLVYDITRLAYGSAAGLWALAWFSVAPFFLVSAGHFVVPDGPLDLALLLTLRLVLPDLLAPDRPPHLGRWCAAGAAFALAFASKYQAVLFGASALAFLVTSPPHRHLLGTAAVWASLAISALGLVPTILWNSSHGWISLGFQVARAGNGSRSLDPVNFLRVLGGQMLYVLPGTWWLTFSEGLRGVFRPRTPVDRMFGWYAILPPTLFLVLALCSEGSLPHWAMGGFLFAFPLVGDWTVRALVRHRRLLEATWWFAAIALSTAFIAVALQARYALFTRPFCTIAPAWDPDWQHQPWPALREAWPKLGASPTVVAGDWASAAKIAHALGPDVTVVPLTDPRHFQFLPAPRAAADVIAVEPADPGDAENGVRGLATLVGHNGYEVIGPPRIIDQRAGGQLRFHIVTLPVRRRD